jgi:hypothetical protein
VIDNDVRAWPTHAIGYCISVNDSGGCEWIARRFAGCAVAGRLGRPPSSKAIEAAKQIDDSPLKNEKRISACGKANRDCFAKGIRLRSNSSRAGVILSNVN